MTVVKIIKAGNIKRYGVTLLLLTIPSSLFYVSVATLCGVATETIILIQLIELALYSSPARCLSTALCISDAAASGVIVPSET